MSFEARMSTEPIVGLTTNFQMSEVDLKTPTSTFIGKIDTITVQCSSISSASTLTLAISEDVSGDVLQLTDTNSTIFSGKTTATDGAAMWKMDSIVYMNSNIAYVWLKTNTGSVTVDHIEITFEEI
jgi:hypothetical protein